MLEFAVVTNGGRGDAQCSHVQRQLTEWTMAFEERPFTLVTPPESAMSWERYKHLASGELRELLNSGECDERKYQELLENHPTLVPAGYPAVDAGQNGMFPPAVITQPLLSGLQSRIPDFAAITHDSGTVYATLVEIESPCKSWATAKGVCPELS